MDLVNQAGKVGNMGILVKFAPCSRIVAYQTKESS
jgi:hypothetical protein